MSVKKQKINLIILLLIILSLLIFLELGILEYIKLGIKPDNETKIEYHSELSSASESVVLNYESKDETKEQIEKAETNDNPFWCKHLPGKAKSLENTCDMLNSFEYLEGTWNKTCDYETIAKDPFKHAYGMTQQDQVKKGQITAYTGFGPRSKLSKTAKDFNRRINALQFEWFPKCDLLPWENEKVAEYLRNKKVYFLGDSIVHELRDSIVDMTGVDVNGFKTYLVVDYRTLEPMSAGDFAFCSCLYEDNGNVSDFERCQDKAPETNHTEWKKYCPPFAPEGINYYKNLNMMGWVHEIEEVDVLVFSIAHHFYKLGPMETMYPKMIKRMITWFETKIKNGWNGKIIYLIQPPGHPNCLDITEPFSVFNSVDDKYKWLDAYKAQHLWKDAFKNSSILNNKAYVLDTAHMLVRGDAHMGLKENGVVDCLHWFLPGPIDTWAQFLYHMLLQMDGK